MFVSRCLASFHLRSTIPRQISSLNNVKMFGTAAAEPQEKYFLKAKLDDQIEQAFKEGLNPKHHPGKRNFKHKRLPVFLERAALRIIARHKNQQFRNDAHRMYQRTFHHQLPADASEVRMKAQEIRSNVIAKENLDMSILSNEEKDFVTEKREKKIGAILRQSVYNWKSIEYNDYSGTVYLAARLAPNYCALLTVFNEIKGLVPDFKPKTLFDFGSGVGSTMYAANMTWPNSITENFNIDISGEMNDLSRLLLQGGDEKQPLFYNGVFYRQFLPVSHAIKYDMVVSAFSLLELPTQQSRIHVLENLWRKTADTLVLIEHGNRDGTLAILEARNLILQMEGYDVTKSYYTDPQMSDLKPINDDEVPRAHILAPCPHHYACPRQFTGGPVLCNFQVPYDALDIGDGTKIIKERFSYIVIKRGKKPDSDHPPWPRVVQPVIKQKGHTVCRLCCPDGTIKSVNITAGRNGKEMYKCSKSMEWGDVVPVTITEEPKPLNRWEQHRYKLKGEPSDDSESDNEGRK